MTDKHVTNENSSDEHVAMIDGAELSRKITDGAHSVQIGDSVVPLHEVLHAYAGLARAGTYYAPSRNLPSQAPVGLFGYAVASMYLGLLLIGVRGITIPNFVVTVGWFVGGVGLLTGGMWEFLLENDFGLCVLGAFGLYWWATSAFYTPSFGIPQTFAAYCAANIDRMPAEFDDPTKWAAAMCVTALGFWNLAWAFFAFGAISCAVKSTVAFFGLLFCVFFLLLLVSVGYLTPNTVATQVGGGFTVASAVFAFYNGMAGLMTKENSYLVLKPILLPHPTAPKRDVEHQYKYK